MIDAVARLQLKIDSGEVVLQFDGKHGYLSSLLKDLNIPVSSQSLVFSKSSEQEAVISPQTPRALYFNDDVYVGWVQGGAIELAAVDPKSGSFFYTLTQENNAHPKFERHTTNCVGCHDSSEDPAKLIPRLLMFVRSAGSPGKGNQCRGRRHHGSQPVQGAVGRLVRHRDARQADAHGQPDFFCARTRDHQYSGIHCEPGPHAGRECDRSDQPLRHETWYLIPDSDIVALTVLAHQTHVHNLIMFATYRLQAALESDPKAETASLAKELAEPVVRAMLFSGETALTDPIAGTSGFAAEFAKPGPRDSRGRSLRDLDLKTRLLRYPLSYVIYSDAFNQMPPVLKDYVYRRLREVLNGEDTSAAFAHLSASDRENILAILKDTKPEAL